MIFMAHMAGLAKPYKIVTGICGFCATEKPKWLDVMNGQALSNVFPAVVAITALVQHDSRACNKPTPAAIGSRAANPIWCIFTFWLGFPGAFGRAEFCDTILTRQPRLLIEGNAAVFACQRNPVLPPDVGAAPHVFGPERICRALTGAKFISDKVGFWCSVQKRLSLPARSAGRAAKSRFLAPVWLNLKRRLADFTGFFNHAKTVHKTGSIGKRTALIACDRVQAAYDQPDLFVEPLTSPVQESMDL